MSKGYKLKKIQALLIEGFSDNELRDFCFYETDFRTVHNQLSPSSGKEEIIRQLIQYAEHRALFENLLAWAKEQNLAMFEKHYPYHDIPVDTAYSPFPASSVIPDPLMNCEDELDTFKKIATGQDTQTRLISIFGPSGAGKSRLLREFNRVADEHKLDTLAIPLAQQLSLEDCLYQIVCHFGFYHFTHYENFLAADRPEPLTRQKEMDWQRQLTLKFFVDLGQLINPLRLALFFDQYEKADYVFKDLFTRVFLPGLSAQKSLIVIVAGQEKPELKAAGPGQHHFHLSGLSVYWFHRYVADCNVQLEPYLINEFHKLLGGYPKRFVDYVRAINGSVS